jgi:hypothetical protein
VVTLPENVGYCRVSGTFLSAIVDGKTDADRNPDALPLRGLEITFTPNLVPARVRSAAGGVTIFIEPIKVTTDQAGRLIGPDGFEGVWLVASDDPDLEPSGWTWKVQIKGARIGVVEFSFIAAEGTQLDLASVIPVPASAGVDIVGWQQAVVLTGLHAQQASAAVGATQTAARNAAASQLASAQARDEARGIVAEVAVAREAAADSALASQSARVASAQARDAARAKVAEIPGILAGYRVLVPVPGKPGRLAVVPIPSE